GGRAVEMTDYYDMLITHAFGNYRDLIESVTLHAAMGDYLSMMANQKADPDNNRFPDENYAREVMQLFSIGLYGLNQDGTDKLDSQGQLIPTYSQDDIENLARVFTGWHIAEKTKPWWGSKEGNWLVPMVAYPDYHDDEQKVVMGNVFAQGQTPEQDMAQAMDMLLNHPNTAPLVSKHLIQRLVTSNPSPAYVARISALFADNGSGVRGDLKTVIRGILTLSWNNFILTNNQLWTATGRTNYNGETNPSRIVINTAPLEAIANDHEALIAEIERRLLSERMSDELREIVLEALEELRDTQQSLKVRNAIYIAVTSQEFHIEELAQ
ncbi:DUF1800 family protein, partial [Vibrio fortis]